MIFKLKLQIISGPKMKGKYIFHNDVEKHIKAQRDK